jgi:hypothetical protein
MFVSDASTRRTSLLQPKGFAWNLRGNLDLTLPSALQLYEKDRLSEPEPRTLISTSLLPLPDFSGHFRALSGS